MKPRRSLQPCIATFAVLMGALAHAGAAVAQPWSDLTRNAMTLYTQCREARETGPSEHALEICSMSESSLVNLRAGTPEATSDERDYVAFTLAVLQLAVATETGNVNGEARSAQSCEASERAWASFGDITPGTTTASIVGPSAAGAADDVRLCRRDFDAPAWGRPLP